MSVRGLAMSAAALALLCVAGCERDAGAKTEESSAERVAEALNPCEDNRSGAARRICQDQALSALDTQVSQTLVAESASISDVGAEMLVQNQRRWRDAQLIACGVIDTESEPSADQQTCLEGQFRSRLQEARTAVEEVGGYTFQRMELVDATAVTAEAASASGLGDAAPPAITRDIRFPRIDGPQTPQIQRFNELVAQQPQFRLEDATSEDVTYRIAFAGPELISVRFDVYNETLGAAHPNSTTRAVTVLMTEGRPLTEADVFRANSGWQRFLTQRAVAGIAAHFREDGFTPPERDVQESATKPHLWLITEQGLTLLFPPYSFGAPYVMGGTEVTIPWADLRPYLNPAAPAPIRPSV